MENGSVARRAFILNYLDGKSRQRLGHISTAREPRVTFLLRALNHSCRVVRKHNFTHNLCT